MSMLARRQLRLQMKQVLETLTGYTIESPFVLATPPRKLPYVGLRCGLDRKESVAKSAPAFTTSTTLEVSARLSAGTPEDAQDAIEDLGYVLEQACLAAPEFVSLLQQIASVTSTTDISGEGSTFVAELLMSVDCECYEEYDVVAIDPDRYPQLLEMDLHVDMKNVADPTGVYAYAPFPAAVTPAPRVAGPDGRDEIYAAIDMSTGLPLQRVNGLSVSGQDILDANGRPIILRGPNWGRWGTAVQQDAVDARAQGANCVRIPLRWWGLYGGDNIDSRDDAALTTGTIDPAHLEILDNMVSWASQAGLYIILFIDSNCGQSGLQPGSPAYCDPNGDYPNGRNFWTDLDARARFIQVWQFVARRYKDNPYLGMFEPLPEPNPLNPGTGHDIRDFYVEVCSAIRLVAPGVPMLVGGDTYKAANINASFMAGTMDIVYTADMFLHTGGASQAANLAEFAGRVANLTSFRTQFNAPVFVQQTGVRSGDDPDQSYLNATLDQLVAAQLGFAYWEERDSTDPNGYGIRYQDGNGGWIVKPLVQAAVAAHYIA